MVTLITGVDFGKMTIYLEFIVCTRGAQASKVDFEEMTI